VVGRFIAVDLFGGLNASGKPHGCWRAAALLTEWNPKGCRFGSDLTAQRYSSLVVFGRTRVFEVRVQPDTRSRVPVRFFAQSVTAHDLQKRRMVCQSQRFGSSGNLPAVLLERGKNDLTLGLGL